MSGTRIVVDGLWRCLCPSVDSAALLRAVNNTHVRTRPRPPHRSQRYPCSQSLSPSPLSHGSPVGSVRKVHNDAAAASRVGRLSLLSSEAGRENGENGENGAYGGTAGRSSLSPDDQLPWVRSLVRARPPYRRDLDAAPTPAIYAALRRLQDAPAAFHRINAFVRYLLEERRETPSAALYEALVRANCHTRGSADAVRDGLKAMKEAKIEGTPSLYRGALSVLAVHPDYLLRNAVLQEMKERWIDLTPGDMQSVALGLLRDGQYERALDQLEAMSEGAGGASGVGSEAAVPPWLFDVFIYVLGQEGFLDDALRIVNHRLLQEHDSVSPSVWYFLLDTCCRRSHYEGLCYVWRRVVRPGLLTPSDSMGLDVLNLAAQHHDSALAAQVMQMLSERGTKLGMPHFEAMLDCYAGAGEIGFALQALCIMHEAGIVPDQGSTRAIYLALTQTPTGTGTGTGSKSPSLDDAVHALFDLKAKYGSVPIAAFNVVMEAALHQPDLGQSETETNDTRDDNLATPQEDAALDLYRHVRQLCPDGPDRTTFRLLFHSCRDVQHLNFLFYEMRAFGLQPDLETVNLLVYRNARDGSLQMAVQHVFDLMRRGSGEAEEPAGPAGPAGSAATAQPAEDAEAVAAHRLRSRPWISRRAAAALAKRCVDEEDPRIWEIAEASRARGRPMDAVIREVVQGMPQEKRNAYGVPRAIGFEDEAPPEESSLGG